MYDGGDEEGTIRDLRIIHRIGQSACAKKEKSVVDVGSEKHRHD